MSRNSKIKFRTLDQLIDSVSDEWNGHDLEGRIDTSTIIKTVKKINKELGFRITKTKETLVNFDNWVLDLPNDLEQLNFALLCNIKTTILTTTTPNEVNVTPCGSCNNVFLSKCASGTLEVTAPVTATSSLIYNVSKRIHIKDSLFRVDNCELTGVLVGDHFLKLNAESGKVYLNYEGILENEEGELLVIDHPLLNDYYEYAVKLRIVENIWFSGEDVREKLLYLTQRIVPAKKEAYNVANMPDFKEIQDTLEMNRKAAYQRYFSMFT